jgi:hypothetical protein
MRLFQLFLTSLAAGFAASEPDEDGFELRQLTEDNFRSSISQGLWYASHLAYA